MHTCVVTDPYLSSPFLSFLLSRSSLVMTLMWAISKVTMVDSAVSMPDTNLDGSMRNWASRRKTPQRRKFQCCSFSTSCRITGMWVYSSIWPEWMDGSIDWSMSSSVSEWERTWIKGWLCGVIHHFWWQFWHHLMDLTESVHHKKKTKWRDRNRQLEKGRKRGKILTYKQTGR